MLKVIIRKKKKSLTIFNNKKHYRINKILYNSAQQPAGEQHKNLLLIFSGLVPTSKGALKLLDDEGWDLDLLSNKNKKSQQKKKLKPYNLRKFRRLRRLKRLRLMSINLFKHRSENIKKIVKQSIAPLRLRVRAQHSNVISVTTMPSAQHSKINEYHLYPQITERNNSNLINTLNLNSAGLSTTTQHSSLINKNKYLIKHNNNKLNFIVN